MQAAGQRMTRKRVEKWEVGEVGGEAGRAGVEVTVPDLGTMDQAKWEGNVVVGGMRVVEKVEKEGQRDRELGRIRWGAGWIYWIE